MSDEQLYGLGALPNPPDERDFVMESFLPTVIEIPPMVSYRGQMTPIKNQGSLGSCVAFASTAMKEYFDTAEFEHVKDLSEQYLYGECKKIDGYSGQGTYPRIAMSVLLKQGEPEEQYMPYEGKYPPQHDPAPGYAENAEQYKISAYAAVGTSVQKMKEALAANGPVGISVVVYKSFFSPVNGVIPPPQGGKSGGHMMCAVGYDDNMETPYGTGAFIVKNSWGPEWGDGGYCFIPYTVWDKIGIEAVTMVDINLKKPEPDPEPEEDTSFFRRVVNFFVKVYNWIMER